MTDHHVHPTPLTASKVGIVYGARSGHVRRHIYVDQDPDFERETLLPGEAMCFVDIAHHHAGHDVFHQAIRDAVAAHGGVTAVVFHGEPGSRMFAHVDPVTGVVDAITMADPDIDTNLQEWVEHPHGTVAPGHVYDRASATFSNPNPPLTKAQRAALQTPD